MNICKICEKECKNVFCSTKCKNVNQRISAYRFSQVPLQKKLQKEYNAEIKN